MITNAKNDIKKTLSPNLCHSIVKTYYEYVVITEENVSDVLETLLKHFGDVELWDDSVSDVVGLYLVFQYSRNGDLIGFKLFPEDQFFENFDDE